MDIAAVAALKVTAGRNEFRRPLQLTVALKKGQGRRAGTFPANCASAIGSESVVFDPAVFLRQKTAVVDSDKLSLILRLIAGYDIIKR